jgi:uncharacterized C2H2 Zn-finger protein
VAELCPNCGGSFATPAELMVHVKKNHKWSSPMETLSMNPESDTPGLVCALCGARFPDRESLARHNIRPHMRSNRTARRNPAYSYS